MDKRVGGVLVEEVSGTSDSSGRPRRKAYLDQKQERRPKPIIPRLEAKSKDPEMQGLLVTRQL